MAEEKPPVKRPLLTMDAAAPIPPRRLLGLLNVRAQLQELQQRHMAVLALLIRRRQRNKTRILKEPILELMCHCCNKRFVNPVYLPCGHTIDKRCVHKQKPFGKCPVCKQYFNGQAQSFPENSFLQRLADVARCRKFTAKLLSNPSCNFDEHRVAVVASAICAMCKLQLCERCKSLHDKVSGAKKHELYLSNNGEQEKIIIDMENICKYHDGKRIIFWCSECKLPACTDCCPCDHRLVDVSKAAKVEEDKIRGLQREIENSLPDIEFQLKIINESEKKIKSQNDDDHFSSFASAALRFNVMKGSVDDVYLQCLYLRDEIKKILAFGGDIELLTAIKFFVIQHENLRKALKSIEPRPQSSISSDRSSSSNPHSSVLDERQSVASDNSIDTAVALDYQNEMFDVGSQKKKREAVVIPQNEENIYMNELPYDEIEVQLRKPLNDTSMEITEKFREFDTEIRITGMTLLDDTIMITSRSAGLCAGYELSGQRKWTITDKLNGPFDLDSYRSDNGEQLLFITDPGKTDDSKSTVMVYLRKKNDRYTHLTRFTNECVQPRGVCVYAGKVYVCEPQSHRMTEYQICKDFKGKIVKIYKEQNVLKEPMYVSAQILSGKIFLIISDKEMGLKRLEKGESGSDSPGWAVSNEKSFTPSKCAITKQEGSREVFVGNSAGRKIHLVNFKPRQISHREYSMEDVSKPVAISVDKQGRIVVACMDGTVLLYEVKETVEMKRLSNSIKEESNYDL